MNSMAISIEEHKRKIKQAEIDLLKSKEGTPHYRDARKHLFRLNKEHRMCEKYLRDNNGKR